MSTIHIPPEYLTQIHLSAEAAYPEEGVGFLLGQEGDPREVLGVLPITNSREEASRTKRYIIAPDEYKNAEDTAERLGLNLIGVFHSHPDHPNQPSEYDKDWAQPLFSYVITSVHSGKAGESRSWRLSDDRSTFTEETITT